jgi:magnesium and cobalt transporter
MPLVVGIDDLLNQWVANHVFSLENSESEDNIVAEAAGRYRVKATTELDDFNQILGSHLHAQGIDTIGGLILTHFGRLPKRGEQITIDGWNFRILRSDSRRLHLVSVGRLPSSTPLSDHQY